MAYEVYSIRSALLMTYITDSNGNNITKRTCIENINNRATDEEVLAFVDAIRPLLKEKIHMVKITESHYYIRPQNYKKKN